MSLSSSVDSPARTPLRDISLQHNTKASGHRCKPATDTPKTSPGPALLLGIRLSAKKIVSKLTPVKAVSNENEVCSEKEKSEVLKFRNLLSSETVRITATCHYWDEILERNVDETKSDCPGDFVRGEIRSTVGQARLIMSERFHQFEGLVDNCEFHTGEKPVTCQDLQGFWEMIYFQVEDVDKKFQVLSRCQAAGWSEDALKPVKVPSPCKKPAQKKLFNKPTKPKSTATANARSDAFAKKRAEARRRLQAAKTEMKKSQQQSGQKTFDAVFFKVDSPVKVAYRAPGSTAEKCQPPETTVHEPVHIVLEPAEQSRPKLFPDVTGAENSTPFLGALPKRNMFLYPATPTRGDPSNPTSPQVHSHHTTPRNSSAWSNISMSEVIDTDPAKGETVTRKSVGTLTRDSAAQTPVARPGHNGDLDVSALIGTAAKNIEKASEILSETPQRDGRNKRVQALVDQGTSFSPQVGKDEKSVSEALQIIMKQMSAFQLAQTQHFEVKRQDGVVREMQDEIESLRTANADLERKAAEVRTELKTVEKPLTCESVVEYLYGQIEEDAVSDGSYRRHYMRLLTKVKMLQSNLDRYSVVDVKLQEKVSQLRCAVAKLNDKKSVVDKKEQELILWEERLRKREDFESKALADSKKLSTDLETRLQERESVVADLSARSDRQTQAIQELNERNEFLEAEISCLKQECTQHAEAKSSSEAYIKELTGMYQSEADLASFLQNKLTTVEQQVTKAFQDYEKDTQEFKTTVARQEAELATVNSTNAKLALTCRELTERVEILQYVEDERNTFQEELAETEASLNACKLDALQSRIAVKNLTASLNERDAEISELKKECATVQQDCDVVQSEAHFIVQHHKEELVYASAGVDEVLKEMRQFDLKLKAIKKSRGTPRQDSPFRNRHNIDATPMDSGDADCSSAESSDIPKNADSISWKVEQAHALFLSITDACSAINDRFLKDIGQLEFEIAISKKQLEETGRGLAEDASKKSELEQALNKRVAKLTAELEECQDKLEHCQRAMKVLADRNQELLNSKIRRQQSTGQAASGMGCKRRSSSSNR